MKQLAAALPELAAIEELAALATRWGAVDELASIEGLPIYALRLGSTDRTRPTLLVTAGVHGLERIGTHVAIAYLTSLVARLRWDELLHEALTRASIIVVPLLNPLGMALGRRANGWGIDLMRNAPDAARVGTPLIGGHRLSPRLPWYMGRAGTAMESESAALVRLVETELASSPLSIALDLHSGFGLVDRLWYPYARTREPPPDHTRIEALSHLLDATLPNHVYKMEQTARVYTIRGDLWDYLYDRRRALGEGSLLPLTLEMGSWTWVRKNPLQGLSTLGRFNPIKPHRHRRTLRRHLPLLDFLLHAVIAHRAWSQ
jgi:hypothetical protein